MPARYHRLGAEADFRRVWPGLKTGFFKLLRYESISRSEWHNLFSDIYTFRSEHSVILLYRALRAEIVIHINQFHAELSAIQDDFELLKVYAYEWNKVFRKAMIYIHMLFDNFENTTRHVNSDDMNEYFEVKHILLTVWYSNLFRYFQDRLRAAALQLVDAERNGEVVDYQLVVAIRESYMDLVDTPSPLAYRRRDPKELYYREFKEPYLQTMTRYYTVKPNRILEQQGIYAYMRFVDQKIDEEVTRGLKYLDCSSKDTLNAIYDTLKSELIVKHMDHMLEKCPKMLRQNDTEMLSLLFKLMGLITDGRGILSILRHIHDFVNSEQTAEKRRTSEIVTDCERFVGALLKLHDIFENAVGSANVNHHLTSARDQALVKFINESTIFNIQVPNRPSSHSSHPMTESRCPELIALYCDMLLRRSNVSKHLSSDEIYAKLKTLIDLVQYIRNKDVFLHYYKYGLTRRLLLDVSIDEEKEEFMVEQFREKCMSAIPISHMSLMFRDLKVSEDFSKELKESQAASGLSTDLVKMKILNSATWMQSQKFVPVTLPIELEDIITKVQTFYKEKHRNRKLRWYHNVSNGTITFKNNVGKFDLHVTTFQMAILFAWNLRPLDKISFEGLRLATELPEVELRKTLFSLVKFSNLKSQVVLCDEEQLASMSDFKESTNFWINQEFCLYRKDRPQKNGRFSLIGRLQMKTQTDSEEEYQKIAVLREMRTKEGIMKIMKMRREISYAQLQQELIDILKEHFVPPRKLIKECIETLIYENCMARVENHLDHYQYIA